MLPLRQLYGTSFTSTWTFFPSVNNSGYLLRIVLFFSHCVPFEMAVRAAWLVYQWLPCPVVPFAPTLYAWQAYAVSAACFTFSFSYRAFYDYRFKKNWSADEWSRPAPMVRSAATAATTASHKSSGSTGTIVGLNLSSGAASVGWNPPNWNATP